MTFVNITPRQYHPRDGSPKKWKRECDSCDYMRNLGEDSGQKIYVCGGGSDFKLLYRDGNPRKCDLLSLDPQPVQRSARYIDKVVEQASQD